MLPILVVVYMSEIFLILGVLQIQITGTVGPLTHEISHTHTHTRTHIYIYALMACCSRDTGLSLKEWWLTEYSIWEQHRKT